MDIVCLRNISINTLHKGDDDVNNNNNNNNNKVYSKLRQRYFLKALFEMLYMSIVIADKICYSIPKPVATKPVSHAAKYSVSRPLDTNLRRLHKVSETNIIS